MGAQLVDLVRAGVSDPSCRGVRYLGPARMVIAGISVAYGSVALAVAGSCLRLKLIPLTFVLDRCARIIQRCSIRSQ